MWNHGIPRQKQYNADDAIAIPLTQAAAFDGFAFEQFDKSQMPIQGPTDKESNPSGLSTSSPAYKEQAINAAARFADSDSSEVMGFATLDRHDHHLRRDATPPSEKEKMTIASVELMPPRHPPKARYWDFFPPLRLIKIITDWFKTRERLEQQERAKGGKRIRAGGPVTSEIPQEIL
jgi:hypothetical protein